MFRLCLLNFLNYSNKCWNLLGIIIQALVKQFLEYYLVKASDDRLLQQSNIYIFSWMYNVSIDE